MAPSINLRRILAKEVRFSLKTLVVTTTVLASGLGFIGKLRLESEKRQETIRVLLKTHERTLLPRVAGVYLRRGELRRNGLLQQSHIRFNTGPYGARVRPFYAPRLLTYFTGEEWAHDIIELKFYGVRLTRGDIRAWSRLRDLETLEIDACRDVVDALIELKDELPKLRRLCVGQSQLNRETASRLIRQHPQLVRLDLWHNQQIDDETLKAIRSLRDLETLNVCGTSVTAQGIAELQRALPDCDIWWDGSPVIRELLEIPAIRNWHPGAHLAIVNRIKTYDEKTVVRALREYTLVADDAFGPLRHNQEDIVLVLPYLFDVTSNTAPADPSWPSTNWRIDKAMIIDGGASFAIEDNLLFIDPSAYGGRSTASWGRSLFAPSNHRYIIDWAVQHGQFQSSPVKPAGDPIAAAQRAAMVLKNPHLEPTFFQQAQRLSDAH